MYNIIAIGDALIDTHVQIDNASVNCDINHEHCHLCLDYAAKIPITGSVQTLGGNAANVACGTTKLGLKTAILSSVGRDSNGQLVKQELKKFGVDTNLVAIDPKAKTRYSVVLNFRGERTILSFHQRRKYAWPKKFPPCAWIYYTGLSEGFEGLQDKLISYLAKHHDIKVAFNPGSYQLASGLNKIKEMIPLTDILIINLEEAEKILGTTLAKEKNISALIHELLALGAKEVAITDAARGAWAGNTEQIWHLDSYPVSVVAKTGAGDAFASGYTAARSYGHDIAHALEWGIANSCAVITQFGAQNGLLNKKGVDAMINKYQNIRPVKL